MIRKEYYQNPEFLRDLNEFDSLKTELAIFANAKNIDRLKDLNITKLWLIGGKDKELNKIFDLVKPQFLNIYQVLSKDLSIIETLVNTETIILRWNSKSDKLWNMTHNIELKALVIEDFSKISSIEEIGNAVNLDYLIIEGGMWTPIKLDTLKPLSNLLKLQFLRLANMRIKEDGLRLIANLKGLKELNVSNQFETIDYAYLSVKLPNTKCDSFKPYITYNKPIGNNDTMITGKRKPFLNSKDDKDKIEKYIIAFNDMVKQFSSNLITKKISN
jgi:Leucine-rich repeat (LRR) protein